MDKKNIELHSAVDAGVTILVEGKGHSKSFDMTDVKTQISQAKAAGKILAGYFINTPVDTIISLGATNIIGAFMAEYLMHSGANTKQDICVIDPDIFDGKIVLGEVYLPKIMNCHVLILKDNVTEKEIKRDVESVKHYGGHLVGIAGIYGNEVELGVPFEKIFEERDILRYTAK